MKKGYFVVQVEITDPARYDTYLREVAGLLEAGGGVIRVGRGSQRRAVEGDWDPEHFFVIEFPSYQAAQDWYFSPGYQAVVGHRLAASRSLGLLAEEP